MNKEFSLNDYQNDFVVKYLNTNASKTLLLAAAGSGKTATSLYVAKQLFKNKYIDLLLIITDRLELKNHWASAARNYNIDTSIDITTMPQISCVSINIQALIKMKDKYINDLVQSKKRVLVIVDDPTSFIPAIDDFINTILKINLLNRALYLSRRLPDYIDFNAQFSFNSEVIFEQKIINLPRNKIELLKYSPSYSILDRLVKSNRCIDDLSWREFEKLIAELLEKDGYVVELMKGTKDGGVDVVAIKDMGAAGYYKTLWQAKKKSIENKVGISIVRELADTRQEFGASKGIIVTTAYLTRGALQRIDRDKYILGKVDRNDLDAWIQKKLIEF